jgi:hypothetical protein
MILLSCRNWQKKEETGRVTFSCLADFAASRPSRYFGVVLLSENTFSTHFSFIHKKKHNEKVVKRKKNPGMITYFTYRVDVQLPVLADGLLITAAHVRAHAHTVHVLGGGLAPESFHRQRHAPLPSPPRRATLGVNVLLDAMPIILRDAEPVNQMT